MSTVTLHCSLICFFKLSFSYTKITLLLLVLQQQSPYVSQAGFMLMLILLPQPTMYGDDKHLPLCLATQRFLNVVILYYIFLDIL